ncbi:hypothetical protein I302_104632 [Kwoniella bestiolae CBS 10118]|uniref:Uncharacterized protein n=1 Tax=Kwoniella bestiolae CBS 10118 TaxID=1296100 RepID=A0A1B9GBT5_9TREE|nr:hypothetical protein I302_03340 [Kwoniella bestiolae CBS 10118]OCF28481.1 hypothetical protein I302_03340 [Kwoniella bestiolae CBS 10118]
MRFFTSCEPDHTPIAEVGKGWREYEKTWEDPEGRGRWKSKVCVGRWSSGGDAPVKGDSTSPLVGGWADGNMKKVEEEKKVGDHSKEEVGPAGSMGGDGDGTFAGNERSKSRNMVILDTILRSTYRAGYNDALKIKPFLPYSDTSSSDPSQIITSREPVEAIPSNINGILLIGGLIVAFTGLITYKTHNKMKDVENGLKEVLALVELTRGNEVNSAGKLSREIGGIRKMLESKVDLEASNPSSASSGLMGDVKGRAKPNSTPFDTSLKTVRSDSITLNDEQIRSVISELRNDLKKEFRMIARDFNGTQQDLTILRNGLEEIQRSILTLTVPSLFEGSGSGKIMEEIQKLNTSSHLLSDKINNLSKKVLGDISGEISLTNQYSKQGLNRLDEVKGILDGLGRDIRELKEKGTSRVGRPKSGSGSGSAGYSSSSGSGSPAGDAPPSTVTTDNTTGTAPPSSAASSPTRPPVIPNLGLNLGLGGNHDVMPLDDIRKAILGVKKSYLNDQGRGVKEDKEGVPHREEELSSDGLKKVDESLSSPNMRDGLGESGLSGPTEGIKFQTPLERVKNPYKLKRPQVDNSASISSEAIPTATAGAKSSTLTYKREDDDDEDTPSRPSPPPPPPPPSAQGQAQSRPNAPSPNDATRQRQTHGHAHWWTVHSFPHSHDIWRIKGFGWYKPTSIQQEVRRDGTTADEETDRSIGAWAFGRVRRRLGEWPFH